MSILLDALRKSERNRRLGEVPTIHGPDSERTGEVVVPWRLLALIVPAFLILFWLAWKQYAAPDIVPGQARDTPVNAASEPVASTAGMEPSAEADVSPPPAEAPARSPVERLAESEREAPAAESPLQREAETPMQNEAETRAQHEEVEQELPGASQVARREATGTLSADEAPGAEPTAAAEDDWHPGSPQPISYWQLPETVRSQIPEMKITVLVYADRPEDRFILLNGSRMTEGQSGSGGLELEEIRPDGVIFRHGMYRFVVKR